MSNQPPFIFILSWERPIYTWVTLDSLYRQTKSPAKFVIADNASKDPLVKQVIHGFERRNMFHAVHYCEENDPKRLGWLVDNYWSEIGDYFVFVESDISVFGHSPCWLKTITDHLDADPTIGSIGSRVFKPDFVSKEEARTLEPDMNEKSLDDLIKLKSPMRKYRHTEEPLVSPHGPPLRLLVFRKKAYAEIGFDRDYKMAKKLVAKGWKSLISTQVAHRHLSLLNIFDNPKYDMERRNDYFTLEPKKEPDQTESQLPTVNQECIFILGMHRSGTSCLAGSLQQAGLFLGDVTTHSPHNKKGNRENKQITRLHEDVLKTNGGSWSNLPNKFEWSSEQLAQLDKTLSDFGAALSFGVKDPRLVFLLEAWQKKVLSSRYIATVRHPAEVVRSLRSRQKGFDDDKPLFDLWYKYNKPILDLWNKAPFPIVNFNCTAAQYQDQLKNVLKALGLPDVKPEASAFFDEDLRNQKNDNTQIPEHVLELYQKLVSISQLPGEETLD